MFYVNLHTLPVGQEMYMAAVGDDEYDEYDIVLPAGLGKDAALALVHQDAEFIMLYGRKARIRGLINQSQGYIIFEDMP